jgi:hypothetical protein
LKETYMGSEYLDNPLKDLRLPPERHIVSAGAKIGIAKAESNNGIDVGWSAQVKGSMRFAGHRITKQSERAMKVKKGDIRTIGLNFGPSML